MSQNVKPASPNFKDVDAESTRRAQAALKGGANSEPLTPPEGARTSTDKKGKVYVRWSEQVSVTLAHRGISKAGLLEVVLGQKVRQSEVEINNGRVFYSRYYINTAETMSDGHAFMNERSLGAIASLLVATGLMPASQSMKASLLAKLFPEKGKPGDAPSLLVGKSVIANISQETEPAKDQKTNHVLKNEDGTVQFQTQDRAESFLPDVADTDEE